MIKKLLLPLFTIFLLGCTDQTASIFQDEPGGSITNFEDNIHGTYASTYRPLESENIVIRNATVFDGNGNKFQNFDVHFSNGKIQAIGLRLVTDGAIEIDGTGKYVTPGIIDNHSHMGVYPAPSVRTSSDCLLYTSPSPRDRTRSRMPSSA